MRIPRIYTEQSLIVGQSLELAEKTSHYLAKVLRAREGSSLTLFNGEGGQYSATIELVSKRHVQLAVNSFDAADKESPLAIHLGISLSKGDRMDFVIQKATELGVTRLSPLFSARSEVKLKDHRAEKKLQHWRQIAISACEQCGRNIVPAILPLQNIGEWIGQSTADKKFVLHHRTDKKFDPEIPIESVDLLVGPEGGLTEGEILLAQDKGFDALSLGPRVLRTETVPLTAISLLQYIWGDM